MAKFSVLIANRDKSTHSSCFEEVAGALSAALRDLSHETVSHGGRRILFGANNMFDVPRDAIIFNTEQVASATGVKTQMKSLETFADQGNVIWDYSRENIAALKKAGLQKVVHCPIGYHSTMTKFEPAKEQDIDVLFYGSLNERRTRILKRLNERKLKVVHLFNVYGQKRDEAIARSKVVLNLHYYQQPIFEIFRVSHLLANKVCVVSEDDGIDTELEIFAEKATTLVPYNQIADACMDLCDGTGRAANSRRERAERGFIEFKKTSFVESVKRALERS